MDPTHRSPDVARTNGRAGMPERRIVGGRGRVRRALLLAGLSAAASGCSLFRWTSRAVRGVVDGTIWVMKTSYVVTKGTVVTVYRIGEFTYEVAKAPIEWALTHDEIESIDGLPAREAIRRNRVKTAPYVVRGRTYVPMSVAEAQQYREEGLASWYGSESGRMTATGEVFDPDGLTAAHKLLPIPMFAKVTSLENGRSLLVRVNDRGPFPSPQNPRSGERIIDLSLGAAKRLGYHRQGIGRVRVESVQLREE